MEIIKKILIISLLLGMVWSNYSVATNSMQSKIFSNIRDLGERPLSWPKQLHTLRDFLSKCEKFNYNSKDMYHDDNNLQDIFKNPNNYLRKTLECWKQNSLKFMAQISISRVIYLTEGVRLVASKFNFSNEKLSSKWLPSSVCVRTSTWLHCIFSYLQQILQSRVLEIDFPQKAENLLKSLPEKTASDTGRGHRRHRYNMLITMMFGVIAFGAVAIPTGFQLLSIVGGKALLLAKMALLLASMNSLKRTGNQLRFFSFRWPTLDCTTGSIACLVAILGAISIAEIYIVHAMFP